MAQYVEIDGAKYQLSISTPTQTIQFIDTCAVQLEAMDPTALTMIATYDKEDYAHNKNSLHMCLFEMMDTEHRRQPIKTAWFHYDTNTCIWRNRVNHGFSATDKYPCHAILVPLDDNKRFDPAFLHNYEQSALIELGSSPGPIPVMWDNKHPIGDTVETDPLQWYHMHGMLISTHPIFFLSPAEVWEHKLLWRQP